MRYIFKHKYLLILYFVTLISNIGCRKFVQVDPPSSQLVTPSVFNNDGSAHSALVAIYSQMEPPAGAGGESSKMTQNAGLLADELGNFSPTASDIQPLYQNALFYLSNLGPWNRAYNYIYQANAIIEGLNNFKGATPAVATQLTGEAKFIRAFWYFYLVNCYGDVPVVTSIDYNTNSILSRAPRQDVYRQIIADLISAKTLLNVNYVNASDTSTNTPDHIRPIKAAAAALLARAYLFADKPDSAEIQATSVINDSRFSLEPDLGKVFLANSTEAIWQIGISQPDQGYQTNMGPQFLYLTGPGAKSFYLTPSVLNSFEPGDQRKAKWINYYTDGTNTWYYSYKYQVYNNTNNPNSRTEYTTMLRLAEQYLIRAEARAKQNNLSGASDDLNAIRSRAGLPNIDNATATSQTALLAAILHERQVELFCEWGHRWFDLIRTNTLNSVMGAPGNICQQKGGVWDPDGHQALYPIPYTEISNDSHLTQNPGY